jgi:hypothetical protein
VEKPERNCTAAFPPLNSHGENGRRYSVACFDVGLAGSRDGGRAIWTTRKKTPDDVPANTTTFNAVSRRIHKHKTYDNLS